MVVHQSYANAEWFTAHKIYFEARPQSGLFVFVGHQNRRGQHERSNRNHRACLHVMHMSYWTGCHRVLHGNWILKTGGTQIGRVLLST